MSVVTCRCGKTITVKDRGRPRQFCSSPCKQAAYRDRLRSANPPRPETKSLAQKARFAAAAELVSRHPEEFAVLLREERSKVGV